MKKRKPIIPADVDPIELADEIKLAIFKDSIKRLREIDKLVKSH